MSEQRSKIWFRFGWHPNEEELLSALDGELSGRQADKVRAHLEGCWACRNRRDKLDRAIAAFMDYCEIDSRAAALPPRASAQFAERLHAAAVKPPKSSFLTRSASLLHWHFAARRWQWSVAAGLLVVFSLGWIWLRAERIVSAQELLQRSTQAETHRVNRVGEPVVYRKLRVTRSGADAPVEWESWNDVQRKQFRQRIGTIAPGAKPAPMPPLLRELEAVLHANHFDAQRPLSAAAFAAWRSRIRPQAEIVTTSQDGLKLTTTAPQPYAVNAITEASLVVRASDWHVVALQLNVQGDGAMQRYELREMAYEVVPLQALTVFADLAPRAAAAPLVKPLGSPSPGPSAALLPLPTPPTKPLPTEAELQEAAIAAQYVLHQAQADLGEPLEIMRDASRQIIVRGVVETAARKQQLSEALRALPLVSVQIQTINEAVQQSPQPNAAPVVTRTPSEPLAVSVAPSAGNPLRQRLEQYFGERGLERQAASQRVTQLSNAAFAESTAALAEVWALRRLAERFQVQPESDAAQQRLAEIQRNHLARLRARSRTLHAQLDDVLAALGAAPGEVVSGGEADAEPVMTLFRAVERLDQLSSTWFVGTGVAGQSATQAARALATALTRVDAALQHYAATVTR